jgi:hypothetical protein
MVSIENDILKHYGKKGMQWGVRSKTIVFRPGASAKAKAKKETSDDHKTSQVIRKQRASQLSNKQIEIANNRANLERNFNRLNPGRISRGQAAVVAIIGTVGVVNTVANLSNTPAGREAMRRGRQMMGRPTMGQQRLF